MHSYLRMPKGSSICNISSLVGLINISPFRFASVGWLLTLAQRGVLRPAPGPLPLFVEDGGAGLTSEFVLSSWGTGPRARAYMQTAG